MIIFLCVLHVKCFFFNFQWRYAVLDGNVCHCTNTINETKIHFSECNKPCTENHYEFCGGSYAQSYYVIEGINHPQNLEIINSTDSSIRLKWSLPEQVKVRQYIIQAIVIKMFGSNDFPSYLEWMVENTNKDMEYELLNLHPGRFYQVLFHLG